MKKLKFKRLREKLSLIDRISICDKERMSYKNFITIKDVPKEYDRLNVCGIGMIESEFYKNGTPIYSAEGTAENRVFLPCIEVVVEARRSIFKVIMKWKKKDYVN